MSREDTAKILSVISMTYPNFKVENKTQTLDAWTWALEEYSYEQIQLALKMYINTSGSAFAPSVAELIQMTKKPAELQELSEAEAWAMVKKAISNGNYHAEEEFEKLPEIVKKAVGGASMIRQWAVTDSNEVNTVIMSNFQRAYKVICKREQEKATLPAEIRNRLGMMNNNLMEVNDV